MLLRWLPKRKTSGNGDWREDFVQRRNFPPQAETGLECATSPRIQIHRCIVFGKNPNRVLSNTNLNVWVRSASPSRYRTVSKYSSCSGCESVSTTECNRNVPHPRIHTNITLFVDLVSLFRHRKFTNTHPVTETSIPMSRSWS